MGQCSILLWAALVLARPADITMVPYQQPSTSHLDASRDALATQKGAVRERFLGRTAADEVILRTGPNDEARVVARVKRGELLVINGRSGDYYSVLVSDGSTAYVLRDVVEKTAYEVVLTAPSSRSEATKALWTALDNNMPSLASAAIRPGADVNARGQNGLPPLMYATGWATESVPILLAASAHVNARDGSGMTALMYAIDKGNFGIVGPLLHAHANPNLRDKEDRSALDWARREHITHNKDLAHEDWVALRRLLRRYGAR